MAQPKARTWLLRENNLIGAMIMFVENCVDVDLNDKIRKAWMKGFW